MGRRQKGSRRPSRKRRESLASYGEWAKVTVAPNQVVAGMLEGALTDRGIPVLNKKLGLDFPTCPSNQRVIMVPRERLEEAEELIEEIWGVQR